MKGDGSLGTDQIANIQAIIGDANFSSQNTIDGQLNAAGNAEFFVDLGNEEFDVFLINPGITLEFDVINFDNVIGTVNSDQIIGNDNANLLSGADG